MFWKLRHRIVFVALFALFCASIAASGNAAIIENEPIVWWDFNSYTGDGTDILDVVQGMPLSSTNGIVSVLERDPGDYAIDFSYNNAFLANMGSDLGILSGAYAIEIDVVLPMAGPSVGEYLVSTGHNQQAIIYGYQGTEVEMYSMPRTDGGPTSLNDGQWHKLVIASYGNAAGSEGFVDKLVYSLDGGPLQVMTREGGTDTSRLDLDKIYVGASDSMADYFNGALDNFAIYDLSRSITDLSGNMESQLDAAVTAIATDQQRELTPSVPEPSSPAITSYGWSVLKDNPKFYYSFNEPESSQVAIDSVRGQTNDRLVSTNATRDAGYTANLGQTAVFDGSSFFAGSGMGDGQTAGAWAIEFWMKDDTAAPGQNNSYIANTIGEGNDTNSPAVIYGFVDGKFELYADSNGRAGDDGPTVADNDWHHVVFAAYGNGVVGPADRLEIAIDGVVTTIDRQNFEKMIDNRDMMVLGAALTSGVDAFQGRLDEFAIYDLSGFSEAEISAKMASLAGHYTLASESATSTLAFVDRGQISYTYDIGAPDISNHSDSSGRELTNGRFGSTTTTLSQSWVGMQDTDVDDGTAQTQITFDLGERVSLDSIWIDYCGGGKGGIGAPDSVIISLSTDGINFGDEIMLDNFNDASLDADQDGFVDYFYARRLIAELGEQNASHVRMSFFSDAEWVFLSEVQFLASGTTSWTPGDANKDGKVDGSDVTILAGNWQMLSGATWDRGDFNGDGKVDGSDVTILAGNWQAGVMAAAASVPEPSTAVLLLAATATLLGLVRRRKNR